MSDAPLGPPVASIQPLHLATSAVLQGEDVVKPDLPLLSYLEVGERASLRRHQPSSSPAPGESAARGLSFRSRSPAILHVAPTGRIEGRAPGIARIDVISDDATEPIAHIQIRVIPRQPDTIRLHSTHPRIRFTAEELQTRRQLIAAGYLPGLGIDLKRHFTAFLKIADEFADESAIELVFEITGETFALTLLHPIAQPEPLLQPRGFSDYPFWTTLSREVERRLTTLTLAYGLTSEVAYAEKARDLLLALAGWGKWHEYDKATNNLSLPHITTGVAIAYDELHDLLSDEERARVRSALLNLGLRPMSYWFNLELDHNIIVLMNAGMVIGSLAIGDEIPYIGKFISIPLAGLRWYVDQRERSTTTEGLVYTSYAMSSLFKAASAIRRTTGNDDLLRSPFVRTTLAEIYLYFRGGPGGYANLSDAGHEVDAGPLMIQLVNEFADLRAAWLVHQDSRESPDIFPYVNRDVPVPDLSTLGLSLSRHFKKIDWVALRTGWNDDDTLLAFTASPSAAGHNHYDQNHFILNVAGEWLITDPGYQNYTPGPENIFTNAAIGHNTLLVNGEGQLIRGRAFVVESLLADGFDYVRGDATATYEGRLQRWHRHIAFLKPEYIVLIDEILPTTATDRLDLLFHTLSQVTIDGEPLAIGAAIDDDHGREYMFHGEHASVSLRFLHPGTHRISHEVYPGAERFGTYLRMQPSPDTAHVIVTLLQLKPRHAASGPLPATVERDRNGLRLTIDRSADQDVHRFRDPGSTMSPTYSLLSHDRDRNGSLRRAVLIDGIELSAGDQTLIRAGHPVSAAVHYDDSASVRATITTDRATTLQLFCPGPDSFKVSGTSAPQTTVDLDNEQLISLQLIAGTSNISIEPE